MGSKFAPTYVTLVLGYLEAKLYTKMAETFDEHFKAYFERMWKRCLEDFFSYFADMKMN